MTAIAAARHSATPPMHSTPATIKRTDEHGRGLGHLADVLIRLHHLLDARLQRGIGLEPLARHPASPDCTAAADILLPLCWWSAAAAAAAVGSCRATAAGRGLRPVHSTVASSAAGPPSSPSRHLGSKVVWPAVWMSLSKGGTDQALERDSHSSGECLAGRFKRRLIGNHLASRDASSFIVCARRPLQRLILLASLTHLHHHYS